MNKKIKINIPGFGERYCSNDVKYQYNEDSYEFCKKGTDITHNEYGPAIEYKNGNYLYFVNNRKHRLNGTACVGYKKSLYFYAIGIFLSNSEKEFIKNLANTLIPKFFNYF